MRDLAVERYLLVDIHFNIKEVNYVKLMYLVLAIQILVVFGMYRVLWFNSLETIPLHLHLFAVI